MAHDIFPVMATRRSVRRFLPRPVEMDKILQIAQAGTLAPSSGNIQNWNFVIVSDIDRIRAMYDLCMQQEAFLSAMAAIVVTGDIEHAHTLYGVRGKRLYTVQNCAAAIQNMLLAAHALDLGAIWIGAFDEERIIDLFNIPDRSRPQAIILLGYPQEVSQEKELKALEDVVFFNTFGNRVHRPHLIFYDWATEWRQQAHKIKGHVAHAVRKIPGVVREQPSSAQGADTQEAPQAQPKEQQPSGLAQARERMQRVIEGLKRDEHRKR